jgi:ppGpp synthetase/RelA/SpoT-type nucleotidyltranferase
MDETERQHIETQLNARRRDYEEVSNFVMRECLRFKVAFPKLVRVVFSREPQVKELPSLIKKIEDERARRAENNDDTHYGFDDIRDIIALTILVPFWSDTAAVIEWLKDTFYVPPALNDEKALRDIPDGHRAYHYIILIKARTIKAEANRDSWSNIPCEIQIKSLLSEAWDAKAHDLTYKTGRRNVSNEVKDQFGVLARILRGIDDQSEFLKNLIENEEEELRSRRDACRQMYLADERHDEPTATLADKLKITSDLSVTRIAETLRGEALARPVDRPLCYLAAHCSLDHEDDPTLQRLALEIVNKHEQRTDGTKEEKCKRLFRAASIKWALGLHSQAIDGISRAIALATELNDSETVGEGKYQYVYFAADWEVAGSTVVPAAIKERATEYTSDEQLLALSEKDPDFLDTRGFFLIAFGTSGEIRHGWNMVTRAYTERSTSPHKQYQLFHEYHEYAAIRRLYRSTIYGAAGR